MNYFFSFYHLFFFKLDRPSTLDWTEFRDIIFPIITGRYLERHIRKLFDLFDTSKDGHLSVQEIARKNI